MEFKGNIFLNADYIVMDYLDLIQTPYFIFLSLLKTNDKLKEIFKVEDIDFLKPYGLFEWYINRKNFNFLLDLNRYPNKISEEQLDIFLDEEMKNNEIFYKDAPPLLLLDVLRRLYAQKLTKDIIIYYPHETKFAKEELDKITGVDNKFMYNFEEILDITKYNSTYFFSDYRHIFTMKNKGYLTMSSVTLALDYNYNVDNNGKLRFNFNDLYKDNPFKLSYCRACTKEV